MYYPKLIVFLIILAGIIIYAATNAPEIYQLLKKQPKLFSEFEPLKPTGAPETTPPKTEPPAEEKAEEIPDYKIPSGFTREDLSPFFEKIQISSVSAYGSYYYPKTVSLYSHLDKDESINISGFKIKSNRSEMIIPKAVNIYSPTGDNKETDVILTNGNYVYIYNAESPLNKNLRLNKCAGYLNNFFDFNPDLPNNCPSIDRSRIKTLSGECQSYIMSLGNCEMPSTSAYNSFTSEQGNACRDFLNTISHGSCFEKHKNDADFLSNEWRLWIKEEFLLDELHDRLLVFDKNGLLIDEYVY